MKNILTFGFFLFLQTAFAQVDPALLLVLNSATDVEMNALTPEEGTIVFNSTDKLVYKYNGTAWVTLGGSDEDWTVSGNDMYAAVSGNVGIGTQSPDYELDVDGDIGHTRGIVTHGPNYSYPWMRFQEHMYGNSMVLGAGGNTILGSGEFWHYATPNFPANDETLVLGSDHDISIFTNTQAGWQDHVHAVQVQNNGFVGIGETNPVTKLEVATDDKDLGAAHFVNSGTDEWSRTVSALTPNVADGLASGLLTFGQSDTPREAGHMYFTDDAVSGAEHIGFAIRSGAWDILTMTGNGDVGVNTTTPRSDLDVNGVLIEGNSTSEYGNSPTLGSCVVSHGITNFFSHSTDNNYIHIKLPYRVDTDARMYHIRATGYRYRSGKVIDITWVGYCYYPSNALLETSNVNRGDSEFSITQYVGSDRHIYLRFRGTTGNNYFQSFRIESMRVGNGSVLKEGDVEIISSASANL